MAANTIDNSAINAPNANTPTVAGPTKLPKPDNIYINPVKPTKPNTPSNDNIGSNPCKAFPIPSRTAFITLNTACIKSGAYAANSFKTPIKNSAKYLTINGPSFVNAFNISTTIVNAVVAIFGAAANNASQIITIPSPIAFIIDGIKFIIPTIIAVKPATIIVVPPAKATANADMPAAISINPPPINIAPAPNNAIAPATANKPGAILFNNIPATPSIVNAAAIAINAATN